MAANGLIRPGEEIKEGDFKVRWGLDRVAMHGTTCLAVMQPCFTIDSETTCEPSSVEVVAYTVSGSSVTATTFEDAINVPDKLRVAMGNIQPDYDANGAPLPGLSQDLYYMELEGESVAMALKSIYTESHYCGFTGLVIKGGSPSYDPTLGRMWSVVEAKYDLRRGSTHEAGDIRPIHWDKEFSAYWSGAVRRPVTVDGKTVEGAEVLPWGACFVRRYQVGSWINVVDAPIQPS
jgi:hypothetical protein